MLPILRILPVGGVFLAIMLLVLAHNPPEGPPSRLMMSMAPMRGAMIDRNAHPEWPQLLMLAAVQRAEELNRLRDLPDTPARTDSVPEAPKIAALPSVRSDPDPDDNDTTSSIMQPPSATIPVEIGEPSAFEVPVSTQDEKPPVIRSPRRVKSRNESRLFGTHHTHRTTTPAKTETPSLLSFLETLFGELKPAPSPSISANTTNR